MSHHEELCPFDNKRLCTECAFHADPLPAEAHRACTFIETLKCARELDTTLRQLTDTLDEILQQVTRAANILRRIERDIDD